MPRPDASGQFISMIATPYVKPAIFVDIGTINPLNTIYVWSGVGDGILGGNTYQGVGQFGMISSIEEGSSVQARGIELSLSGLDPTLLTEVMTDYQQGLPVKVYLALCDLGSGQPVSAITSFSGRTDQPSITVGGDTATITIACESRLIDMNTTSSFRRYTNEDQQIEYPGDLAFAQQNAIQQQTLYWGRVPGRQNLGVSSSS
jgi:hypothetical protein